MIVVIEKKAIWVAKYFKKLFYVTQFLEHLIVWCELFYLIGTHTTSRTTNGA